MYIGIAIGAVAIAAVIIGTSSNKSNDDQPPLQSGTPASYTGDHAVSAADFVNGHDHKLMAFDLHNGADSRQARCFTSVPVSVVGQQMNAAGQPGAGEGILARGDYSQMLSTQGFGPGVDRYGPHTFMSIPNKGSPFDMVEPAAAKTVFN